jgi:hypothetical protein
VRTRDLTRGIIPVGPGDISDCRLQIADWQSAKWRMNHSNARMIQLRFNSSPGRTLNMQGTTGRSIELAELRLEIGAEQRRLAGRGPGEAGFVPWNKEERKGAGVGRRDAGTAILTGHITRIAHMFCLSRAAGVGACARVTGNQRAPGIDRCICKYTHCDYGAWRPWSALGAGQETRAAGTRGRHLTRPCFRR